MWTTLLLLFLLYKLLDRLIRIPMRSAPSSTVNNILVTGCDTGFGRILAQRLAGKGFRVFATCLTEKGCEELAKSSTRIQAVQMDVTQESSIERGYTEVKAALSKGEGLWAVVNNAGVMQGRGGPHEWLRREDYINCCNVNTFGLIDVTRIFLPLLKLTKGRIVNTASIAGRVGFPTSAVYGVSKYAVEGFSDCIRPEMRPWGISVHVLEPGFHATNLVAATTINRAIQLSWERLPQDLKDEYGEEYLTKSQAAVTEITSKFTSTRLEDVVDCYEHAILAYFPRGRYMPGKDARFLFWPLSYLPEWFHAWFFNRDPNIPVPAAIKK